MPIVHFFACSFSLGDPSRGGNCHGTKSTGRERSVLGQPTALLCNWYTRFTGHLAWGIRKCQSCNVLLFLLWLLDSELYAEKKKKNPLSFVALSKLSLFHLLSWVFKGQGFHLTFIFQFSWNLDNCSGVHKLGSACPRLPVDRERQRKGQFIPYTGCLPLSFPFLEGVLGDYTCNSHKTPREDTL